MICFKLVEGPLTRGQMLQWSKWKKEKIGLRRRWKQSVSLPVLKRASSLEVKAERGKQSQDGKVWTCLSSTHTHYSVNFQSQNYNFIHNLYTKITLSFTGSHICILWLLQKVQFPVEFPQSSFISTNIGLLPLPLKYGAHKITESCPWQPNGVVDVSVRVKLSLLASQRELFFNNLNLFHISIWQRAHWKLIGWTVCQ